MDEPEYQNARNLAWFLAEGGVPTPIPTAWRIDGAVYMDLTLGVSAFCEAEAGYRHIRTKFPTSPLGVAVTVGATALNRANRNRAAHKAQAQWRDLGPHRVVVTDHALRMQQIHRSAALDAGISFDQMYQVSVDPRRGTACIESQRAPLALAGRGALYAGILIGYFRYHDPRAIPGLGPLFA